MNTLNTATSDLVSEASISSESSNSELNTLEVCTEHEPLQIQLLQL